MKRLKEVFLIIDAVLVVAVLIAGGIYVYQFLHRNHPQQYANIVDHFEYGSIGAEGRGGVPYWIWKVLPTVFPQYLPNHPGTGYARIGFIYRSPTDDRPIGTSYREDPIARVGLNCATCHVSTVRYTSTGPEHIVDGMPAQQLNLEAYFRFLFNSARDPHFNANTLIPAIKKVNPGFSLKDQLLYRFVVIPRTRDALLQTANALSWLDQHPDFGPGRVDTFNPYISFFFHDMSVGNSVGTVDLPSLWDQRIREHMSLHWDGNNNSLDERNKSAAIGAGATPASLDVPSLQRVADWIMDLKPPPFPADKIDQSRIPAGRTIYEAQCAECHSVNGKYVGQVTPISEVGTDPARLDSFTPALASHMNTIGTGYPWRFSHFRKTDGYANMPLDGLWLRAPYLHNGSVPTLTDLLKPPSQRPVVFYRGDDLYDFTNVGFVSDGAEAERVGYRFDTRLPGNGNQGHTYGTDLTPEQKRDLIEYLKTL